MRPRTASWTLAAVLATCSAVTPGLGVDSTDGLRPEVVETFLRMRVLAAVLDTRAIENSYPGPTTGLVPVSSVATRLSPKGRMLVGSAKDAWGNPLLYWSDGRDYLILSLGSDRTMQFDYDATPPYANVRTGWAGSDPTNDLLIVDGVAYRGPESQSELLRRAMTELRTTGTACESFAVDNNRYPGPVEPIDMVATIEPDLVDYGRYLRVLQKLDPWGNPYMFWSDSTHYALVSFGVDGVPDHPYSTWSRSDFESLHAGPTTVFGADLIFANGVFVQWPVIGQGP